jgi:hypothetical protein
MQVTVVANATGDIIGAIVHSAPSESDDVKHGARIKNSANQIVVTVHVPPDLVNRVPNGEYLDILRNGYVVRNSSLEKR